MMKLVITITTKLQGNYQRKEAVLGWTISYIAPVQTSSIAFIALFSMRLFMHSPKNILLDNSDSSNHLWKRVHCEAYNSKLVKCSVNEEQKTGEFRNMDQNGFEKSKQSIKSSKKMELGAALGIEQGRVTMVPF